MRNSELKPLFKVMRELISTVLCMKGNNLKMVVFNIAWSKTYVCFCVTRSQRKFLPEQIVWRADT